jgi:hypothetical protein
MCKKMILVMVIVLAIITAAFAQTEADFEMALTEDEIGAIVFNYVGKAASVRIPAALQEMPVKEPGKVFLDNAGITSVVIPEGVVKINGALSHGAGTLLPSPCLKVWKRLKAPLLTMLIVEACFHAVLRLPQSISPTRSLT